MQMLSQTVTDKVPFAFPKTRTFEF